MTLRLSPAYLTGVLLSILATSLLLSGCSTEQPTTIKTPNIIWKDGIEPSSPLENNEYVKALRSENLGRALAWNIGDFTIAQLTRTETHEQITTLASQYSSQGDDPSVILGPDPFQPISVENDPNGHGVLVSYCELAPQNNLETPVKQYPKTPISKRTGSITVSRMVKDGKTARITRIIDIGSNEACDPSTIPIGYFSPAPKPPKNMITEPVRPPMDPSYGD